MDMEQNNHGVVVSHLEHAAMYATGAVGSLWWAFLNALRHGPSWEIVPPILFGLASVIAATNSYLNDRLKRLKLRQDAAPAEASGARNKGS